MNPYSFSSRCNLCDMNRRRFLSRCAACLGTAGLLGPTSWLNAAEPAGKPRIRIVFALHAPEQSGADWPNKGFDFKPVMARLSDQLTRRCRGFQFLTAMANGEEAAKKILDEDKADPVDGYIVFQLNCWNRVVQPIAASGKPVLYADFQYGGSGGFLVYTAAFLRAKTPNVGFVASSRIRDLADAVNCFENVRNGESLSNFLSATERVRAKRTRKAGHLACKADPVKAAPIAQCIEQMKQSKILAVRSQESGPAGSLMGIPVVHIPFSELNEAWQGADRDEARAVADRWQRNAEKIVGVSRETLVESAAMYLAEKALLKNHGANAISINCLGGFYGGHIHAYPCLGFYQLNNEGLVGGCECDTRSAATMVAGTLLTQGRPGYISDPVLDSSKRQIIYAHCVAHTRAFGQSHPDNPFQILTHSEDRQGASVRSILPLGYMTTTLQIAEERKEILFHQGKAVANDPDDRACRTKLAVEPLGDFEKLFTQWDRWGWHRVTFYGDLKEPIHALADALGWKVVEEA